MNISNYKTVVEFYEDAKRQGYSLPLALCAKLSKLIKERGLTLQEAYNFLYERELIILVGKTFIYNLSADKL
jgi:hypothetical protein